MAVVERVYPLPSEDELAQLVGAATPHFAFQIRDRVAEYAAALPADHPRQPELRAHLERLERLGVEGEPGRTTTPDLSARQSLVALYRTPPTEPPRGMEQVVPEPAGQGPV